MDERIYYIRRCATEHYTVEALKESIAVDDFHYQAKLPNKFFDTLPTDERTLRAVNTFKDEYLLDFINVEEIAERDKNDINEKVVLISIMGCHFYISIFLKT